MIKALTNGGRPREERIFLPGQKKFLEDSSAEVLYSGAFASGKTRVLCEKALMVSLLFPGNRGLLCRKQLMAVKATTLSTLLEGDGSMEPVLPGHLIEDHNRTERRITLTNGSEILYGGIGRSEDINWIKSLNLGWVGVDQSEEISHSDWMLLLGRLRLDVPDVRQGFMVCNPAHPAHWLYQRFFVDQPRGTSVVEANTLENHYLPKDYIKRLLKFKGVHRQRYVLGRWVEFEGMIWPTYSPGTHIIEPFELPSDWLRFRAIDFGYVHPFVCQWWAVANEDYQGYPEGSAFLYREWYKTRWTTNRHAERINELTEGETVLYTVCDWDAENRADLETAGIMTTSADKAVKMGIEAVDTRLGNIYVDEETGDAVYNKDRGVYIPPTLYVFKNALVETDDNLLYDADGQPSGKPTCTMEEIPRYHWKRVSGEPTEEPSKKDDHGCDAMRYGMMSIRLGNHHGIYL